MTGHLTFVHVQRAVKICQYYLGFACLACNVATSSSYQQKFYTAEMALPLVFEDTDNDKLIYALIISRSALNQCSFIIQLKCGVDTANQMLEGYSTRAATGRWSVAVFLEFIRYNVSAHTCIQL